MGTFKKIYSVASRIERLLLGGSIIMMSVILIINVLLRLFFSKSLSFSEEIGQILLICVTFIGLSYVTQIGKHVRMSAIFDLFPAKGKKLLSTFIAAVNFFTMLILGYYAVLYTLQVYRTQRVSPALSIPMYLVIAIISLGFFSSAVQYLIIILRNVRFPEIFIGVEAEDEENPSAIS
jgi:TRAP-type C4-dicarboxylate transport system permease small subunit